MKWCQKPKKSKNYRSDENHKLTHSHSKNFPILCSSNLTLNLVETSASDFSLLESEKGINLIESPKNISVPKEIKDSSAPTLSSKNLLDCSLPKQETFNSEMDKDALLGKLPYHLTLLNLINISINCYF